MSTPFSLKTISFLVISTVTSAYAGPPSFAARTELDLGSVVTTGDYNGDGIPDLISAGQSVTGDYEINIQLGDGKGGFTQGPTVDLGSGFTPVAIAAADFNGDGKLDVAVLSGSEYSSTSALYVAIQHANGFLITPIELPETLYGSPNLAVGDLNGDHLPDIVVPTNAGTTFVLNAGNGKFKAPEFASTTPSTYVVMADLNIDGRQDLLAQTSSCCYSTSILVMLGDGHGGFYEPASQPDVLATKFAVADLNGDGKPDLAVVDQGSFVSILPGLGNGTFGSAQNISLPVPFIAATAIAVADLNGDGTKDLAVISGAGYGNPNTALIVLTNSGKAVFNTETAYSIPQSAANIIMAAFTSSKAIDILLTPSTPALDALLMNNGKGVFGDGATFATQAAPTYMISGDFNKDGRVDLATVNSSGLTVYLNSGNISILTAETALPFYTGPLITGDFNDDGRLDIVDVNNESASLLLGAGGGTFVLEPTTVNLGGTTSAIAAADMNGDGKLDLVTSSATVILGNGDGTFQPPSTDPNTYCYYYGTTTAVSVADFNRDGKPDVVSLCGGQIAVYLNTGSGSFTYPNFYTYANAEGMAVGDFNKDGLPDFAYVVSFYSPATTESDVYIEFGNGDGTFNLGPPIPIPGNVSQLLAVDFTGDGILDLAGLDTNDSAVVVLQGVGDGTFLVPQIFGTASDPTCLIAAKLHDPARPGYPDLVSCSAPGISIDYNTSK